jgi:hypothetical protein
MKPIRADVSRPPLKCAGRKQLRTQSQALIVSRRAQSEITYCRFCGCYHLKGPRK